MNRVLRSGSRAKRKSATPVRSTRWRGGCWWCAWGKRRASRTTCWRWVRATRRASGSARRAPLTTPTGAVTETAERDDADPRSRSKRRLALQWGDRASPAPRFPRLKVEGRRAHALVRQGAEVKLAARPVRIDAIRVLRYEWPFLDVGVDCGKWHLHPLDPCARPWAQRSTAAADWCKRSGARRWGRYHDGAGDRPDHDADPAGVTNCFRWLRASAQPVGGNGTGAAECGRGEAVPSGSAHRRAFTQ